MKSRYLKNRLFRTSAISAFIALSIPISAYGQTAPSSSNSTTSTAAIAAEESAQQAAAQAAIAAEEAAQQAAAQAAIAAEEAAQQAAAQAALAAEQAAQQAAAQAAIAAEESAQQAAAQAAIAAEESAQQAAAQAAIAAEESAQQAAAQAAIAAEESAQQAAATASAAAEESAQSAATTGSQSAAQAAESASVGAIEAAIVAAEQSSHSTEAAIAAAETHNVELQSLHFGSEAEIFQAPNSAPVEIIVGGEINASGGVTGGTTRLIAPGEQITAAELEAVQSILQSGIQNVLLNDQGHAVGGHVSLLPQDLHGTNELFVPETVSLNLINFSTAAPVTVPDLATIEGSVFAFHETQGVESLLNFGSLEIAASGLLSGSVPDSALFTNYFSSSALTINTGSLLNAGVIASPGALAINAASTLTNTGVLSGASVAVSAGQALTNTGQITATTGNVNLSSATGQIVNNGTISAINASVNFLTQYAGQNAADIALDNSGGLISAAEQINFRELAFDDKANIDIQGGDFLSKELNLNGGRGIVGVDAGNISGIVNSRAHEFRIRSTGTGSLTIGNIETTGDPTIIGLGVSITLAGFIATGGAPLAVITDQNIMGAGSFFGLDSGGGSVLFAAGTSISDGGTVWNLNGASATGGYIYLPDSDVSPIDTGGGDFVAVAYGGSDVNSGEIVIQHDIFTSGGDATVIGGASNPAGNDLSIFLRGVNTGGGNATIAAATVSSGSVSVDKVTGAATNLDSFTPGATVGKDIEVDFVDTFGGNASLLAGDGFTNGNILVNFGIDASSIGPAGTVSIQQASSNPFVVGSGAGINGVPGGISSDGFNGGTISIINNGTGGITIFGAPGSIGVTPQNNGGNIILSTPGPVDLNGSSLDVSAPGNGGSISITAGSITNTPNFDLIADGGFDGGSIGVASGGTLNNLEFSATGASGSGGYIGISTGNIINTGFLDTSGGTNGGAVGISTFTGSPFTVGDNSVNGVAGIDISGGTGAGGKLHVLSNGVNVGPDTAIDGSGAFGGVISFTPLLPTVPVYYNLDTAAIVTPGIVAFGGGPKQDLFLNLINSSSVVAGTQITLGNHNPFTGLEIDPGQSSIFVNDLSALMSPKIVFNLFTEPPEPPTMVIDSATMTPAAPTDNNILFEQIGTKIPIDQTPIQPGETPPGAPFTSTQAQVQAAIEGTELASADVSVGSPEFNRLTGNGVILGPESDNGVVDLIKGTLYIHGLNVLALLREGAVDVRSDAQALIIENGDDSAVYNLHESRPGGVKVKVGNKELVVPPGKMVFLSKEKTKNFSLIKHKCKQIGYRNPKYMKLTPKVSAYVMEFSIPSAMSNTKILKRMIASKKKKHKKLVNQMALNSVLLRQHNAGKGAFVTAKSTGSK